MTNNSVADAAVSEKAGNGGNGRKYRPGRIRERNREKILQAAEEEFAFFFKGYPHALIEFWVCLGVRSR